MAAVDNYLDRQTGLDSPARNAVAVVPHDTTTLANVTRGLWVGTGGDVTVLMAAGGSAVAFLNVPDGSLLPIQIQRVNDTGTDADDMVALW